MKAYYRNIFIIIGLLIVGSVTGAPQPQDIAEALSTIEREAITYPSRSDDMRTLKKWLADGEYRYVRSQAAEIIQKQRNLRSTQQNGLPKDIQQLLDIIKKEVVAYPSRSDDLRTLNRWLANGEYRYVKSQAVEIIQKQRNLRQSHDKTIPKDIQQLLDIIEKEAVAYPSRSDDLRTLNRWLANGEYRYVKSQAAEIIQKQRNLR